MLDPTMQDNCLKLQEEHVISHLMAGADAPWRALDYCERDQFQNSKHYAKKDRLFVLKHSQIFMYCSLKWVKPIGEKASVKCETSKMFSSPR